MKTLVTGADGFLGSNVVRELLRRSHEVRVFLQPGRSTKTLEGLDIEIVKGDLLEIDDVEKAVTGCNSVVHCAALTAVWPTRHPAFSRVNVQGTRHVIQAALKSGIERMVHVSSASAFVSGTIDAPGNERQSASLDLAETDYVRSKIAGQQLVLDAVRQSDLPAIVVNPTFMIGPYDSKPSSGAMILAFVNRKLPGYTAGGRNFVHVRDAAVAMCNALTQGRIGDCYVLGGHNFTYHAFFEKIASLTRLPPLRRNIRAPFIRLYGLFGSLIGTITGQAPTVSYHMAKIATMRQFYSPDKARRELGLPDTPIEHAIADAIRWFARHDYLDFPVNLAGMTERLPLPVSPMQPFPYKGT